jgi:hypothetical protein
MPDVGPINLSSIVAFMPRPLAPELANSHRADQTLFGCLLFLFRYVIFELGLATQRPILDLHFVNDFEVKE